MLDFLISNLLVVVISFFGLCYMISGKPKKKSIKLYTKSGDEIFFKKSNITHKIMTFIIFIIVIKLLLTMDF